MDKDIANDNVKINTTNSLGPLDISHKIMVDDNSTMQNEFEPLPSCIRALELLNHAVSKSKSVLIQGPVGCGKSYIVQHFASINGKMRAPDFCTVQLGEHMDGKALFGTYQCGEIPGEFIWVPGPLTRAICDGYWVLLEDLNCAPADVLSALSSVLESRTVHLLGRGEIKAHPNFRLFATLRTENGTFRSDKRFIQDQNWIIIAMEEFGEEEASKIICKRYPQLNAVVTPLLDVFRTSLLPIQDRRRRIISFRDFLKLCKRICLLDSVDDGVAIFREAADCLSSHIRNSDQRLESMMTLAAKLNVNREKVVYYFQIDKPTVYVERNSFIVGRVNLERRQSVQHFRNECLALTRPTCGLLEKLAVCVHIAEPVLLVGETGCGKTAAIQFLARHTGSKLHVVNMSQQSENSDLTGGFKPTDAKHLTKSLKECYVELFSRTFSTAQNETFLHHVQTCYLSNRWRELIQLMRHTGRKGAKNKDQGLRSEWIALLDEVSKLERVLKYSGDGLAFAFAEGVLTKALMNGDWILLDEINLASPEAIDCLYTLLDSQSRNIVSFSGQNSLEPLRIHSKFRLFACMNPSGDVGKKELPTGIRNRFTEIFVSEPDSEEDLREIVRSYLGELSIEPKQMDVIVQLYLVLKSPPSIGMTWPYYSLRTLCRCLAYARTNPYGNVQRSIYEAFCLSFLTELDPTSYNKVESMIREFLIGKDSKLVARFLGQPFPPPSANGEYIKVQGYWVKCGRLDLFTDDRYLLTATVKKNLRDIARAVAARNYPILLQGETSVGKTSLIMHLAKLTGNKCIRINNHEHTDIQEYVGTYATDENNKLVFVEGPLVQAMRNGDWIILDELNLSPPDVLEALNRVLDDNRELFIAETQEVIKAHPDFILFATQNPAGIYGGRKTLSRAFRYRFIELRFNELPFSELEEILQHRCSLPLSYARKMVKVMRDLQIHRSSTGVFVGRESYMTLRDLFRWGERYRLATVFKDGFQDWDQYLADQGYLLLGCRARREEDEAVVCRVLQTHFSRMVTPETIFAPTSQYLLIDVTKPVRGYEHMVWTFEARRLAVLIGQSLKYNEPSLLIGETGCGKTTLCQIFAETQQKPLRMINCHMMTEAADFIGRLAPASADKMEKGVLFEWRDGTLVSAMRHGCPLLIDEISLADDSVLERLNSVLEPERSLLLAEKGSGINGSTEMIRAADGFALMATMNPGGDYGKKELSRALRNRFTEIWCRNIFDSEDCIRIIEHNVKQGLKLRETDGDECGFGRAMLQFVSWFLQNCPVECRRIISVRDVICWVNFVNGCSDQGMPPFLAFIHGAMAIFVDGLGGNKSFVNLSTIEAFRILCAKFLVTLACGSESRVPIDELVSGGNTPISSESQWGLQPFALEYGECDRMVDVTYSFDTYVCRKNLFRLLRAMQMAKPILLEGSPGVGKTSLVVALTKATGHRLTRINLSEQTDISDLFGSELPTISSTGQQIFTWVDGPFLTALKNGHWILIDEMNLASQSVLEGLNACFDHRGEIYVPEIDRSFKVDKTTTRFFASQNPHNQGGNRKGLPKSFLNRFSVVLVEALSFHDQRVIMSNCFPDMNQAILDKMIKLNEEINKAVCIDRTWGQLGSPWEFNLRDLLRWCELMIKAKRPPTAFSSLIYASRFRCIEDRKQFLKIFEQVFESVVFEPSLQFDITPDLVQIGDAIAVRQPNNVELDDVNDILLCRTMLRPLRLLIHCVNAGQLAILVGQSGTGKTCLVKTLAALCGYRLRTIYLTSDSDSSDLLGSFEQVFDDSDIELIKRGLLKCCGEGGQAVEIINRFDGNMDTFDKLEQILAQGKGTEKSLSELCQLKAKWLELSTTGKRLRFTWIDSPLVEAVKNGDWILLENVNYCSPAVLDRLNSLLESNGELVITERGLVDGNVAKYNPHLNFRIFYTMNPTHGSISRAMRNRGIEICLLENESWPYDSLDATRILTKEIGDYRISTALADEFVEESTKGKGLSIRALLQRAFEKSVETNTVMDLSRTSTAFGILAEVNFQGHISIRSAVEDPVVAKVVRDASYMVQLARNCSMNQNFISSMKLYILTSSPKDASLRFSLINWMEDEGIIMDPNVLSVWRNIKTSSPGEADFRWNLELARYHNEDCLDLESQKSISVLDKYFLYANANWILTTNICYASPGSLCILAKEALKTGAIHDIPASILLVGNFFELLLMALREAVDQPECCLSLNSQVLTLLLRLQVFANLYCVKRVDFILDADLFRLFWIWLSASFKQLPWNLSSGSMTKLVEICQSLDRQWSSERFDWKIYASVRSSITGMDFVFQNTEQANVRSVLSRLLTSLNDTLVKCIVYNQSENENDVRQLGRAIIQAIETSSVNQITEMEERVIQMNCGLNMDDSEPAVFTRRDILMRKLSVICHLKYIHGGMTNQLQGLRDNYSLLPFGQLLDCDNFSYQCQRRPIVLLAEILDHCLMPIKADGVSEFLGDLSGLQLKAYHLIVLPLETLVYLDILNRNIKYGSLQTSIWQIPRFSKEIETFLSYIWRLGVTNDYLELRLINTLTPLLTSICKDLLHAFGQLSAAKHVQEFIDIIQKLHFGYHAKLDTFYGDCVDLGLLLCKAFTPPSNCIDPVVKDCSEIISLDDQIHYIDVELECLNGQYELLTGQPLIRDGRCLLEFAHPYVNLLLETRKEIISKLIELGSDRERYRPRISQFDVLGRKFREFMGMTEHDMVDFREMIKVLDQLDNSTRKTLLAKMQNWLRSCESFTREILDLYSAYVDITLPFVTGLRLLQLTINRWSVQLQMKLTTCSYVASERHDKMIKTARQMLSLNLETLGPDDVEYFSAQDVISFGKYAHTTILDKTRRQQLVFSTFNRLLETWRDHEEEKRQKREEPSYEYKSKQPLSIEEQEAVELNELFPLPLVSEDEEENQVELSKEPKFDEDWFGRMARLLLNGIESSEKDDGFWPAYEAVMTIVRRYPTVNLDLDEATHLASHLLALHHVGQWINGSRGKSSQRSLNVYKDCDLDQSAKLQNLITHLVGGAKKLLIDWPDNEALILVCEKCQAVLNLPAKSTIMVLALNLERLIVIVEQWEKVAASHVKLEPYLQPLRSLLLDWRKMELTSWERLLEDAELEYQNKGALSVLHFSIVWKTWLEGRLSNEEILKCCGLLLDASPVGEFISRTELAIALLEMYAENGAIQDKADVLLKLRNVLRYYSQYVAIVQENVIKERQPIEKELKEFLKIVKYQDLNLWSIKKSAADAHRKLFKLVKQYKEILSAPVLPQIDLLPTTLLDLTTLPATPPQSYGHRAAVSFDKDPFARSSEILIKSISYHDRLSSITVELSERSAMDEKSILSAFTDLREGAEEMVNLFSKPVQYSGTDDEKTKLFKRTLQIRQKMAANFFMVLRDIGFSYRKGASLDERQLNDNCFVLPWSVDKGRSGCLNDIYGKAEKCYWSAISRKTIFDKVRTTPHEQIEPQTSHRCFGFTQHLTSLLLQVQQSILISFKGFEDITSICNALRTMRKDIECRGFISHQMNGKEYLSTLKNSLLELRNNLETTSRIWKCCPNEKTNTNWDLPDVIIDASPKLCTLTSENVSYLEAMEKLEEMGSSVDKAEEKLRNIEMAVTGRCGYISWNDVDEMNTLSKSLLSRLDTIDQLLKVSTVPDQEANFLSNALVKAREILFRLSAFVDIMDNADQNSTSDDVNAQRLVITSDSVLKKVLLATQATYQTVVQSEPNESLVDTVRRLVGLLSSGRTKEICTLFNDFLNAAVTCQGMEHMADLVTNVEAFVERYAQVVDLQYRSVLSAASAFYGCYNIIVDCWTKLLKSGYLEPIPLIKKDGDGEGETTDFQDIKDGGLGEGEGMKDVSDQITDVGQVEGLKNEKENAEENAQRPMEDVDKPIEMDDDLDAATEDIPQEDEVSNSDDDEKEDNEPDMEWKKGEAEQPQEEQLDPGLWEPPADEKADQPPLDDSTKGADKLDETLAAKDDRLHGEHGLESNDNAEEDIQPQDDGQDETQDDDGNETFDLENVNLDDQDEKVGENEEDVMDDSISEVGDITEDVDKNQEQLEEDRDELGDEKKEDKADAAEKTFSSGGAANSAKQDGESGEAEDNCVQQGDNADQQKDLQTSESRESTNEDRNSLEAQNPFGTQVKDMDHSQPREKRSSADLSKSSNKRQRLSDENKTMGNYDEEVLTNVDMEQPDQLEDTNADRENVNEKDKVFSHRPDMGPDGVQVVDSATVETALKQSLDTRRLLITVEEEKVKREIPKDPNTDLTNQFERDRDLRNDTTTERAEDVDMAEEGSSNVMRDMTSTIHTVMDFYSHAKSANFDELLQQDIRHAMPGAMPTDQAVLSEWYKYVAVTEQFSLELTENLRLILEPTIASKLEGDYRSGKRLNIRKLIPYIASHFRKNKIWLRRTKKAKRDYQILLAIDDSSSMKDNVSMELAFESLALLSNALRHLEVGRLGVCKFGEAPELLHSLDVPFVESSGAYVMSRLQFEQKKTNIAALLDFVATYFAQESSTSASRIADSLPAQLLLIVSDGRGIFAEGMDRVKEAVQQTLKLNIFTVFIILDNPAVKHSILDVKFLPPATDGPREIKPYLEYFPFPFYIILRQVAALPAVMGDALRQWFEIVVSQT